MNNGATMDYKFGPKNHWRRTMHNRIVERLAVKPSEALAIYLSGEQDLDRREFLRRGFRPHNLFPLDRNKGIVHALRAEGKLAISGELTDALCAWKNHKVHVFLADLCCGVTSDVMNMVAILNYNSCFDSTVAAFNLMRGRDRLDDGNSETLKKEIRHRGEFVISLHAAMSCLMHATRIIYPNSTYSEMEENVKRPEIKELANRLQNHGDAIMRGWSSSYRSTSKQVFDSCVFRVFSGSALVEHGVGLSFEPGLESSQTGQFKKMQGQLAAIKATRTRYLQTEVAT